MPMNEYQRAALGGIPSVGVLTPNQYENQPHMDQWEQIKLQSWVSPDNKTNLTTEESFLRSGYKYLVKPMIYCDFVGWKSFWKPRIDLIRSVYAKEKEIHSEEELEEFYMKTSKQMLESNKTLNDFPDETNKNWYKLTWPFQSDKEFISFDGWNYKRIETIIGKRGKTLISAFKSSKYSALWNGNVSKYLFELCTSNQDMFLETILHGDNKSTILNFARFIGDIIQSFAELEDSLSLKRFLNIFMYDPTGVIKPYNLRDPQLAEDILDTANRPLNSKEIEYARQYSDGNTSENKVGFGLRFIKNHCTINPAVVIATLSVENGFARSGRLANCMGAGSGGDDEIFIGIKTYIENFILGLYLKCLGAFLQESYITDIKTETYRSKTFRNLLNYNIQRLCYFNYCPRNNAAIRKNEYGYGLSHNVDAIQAYTDDGSGNTYPSKWWTDPGAGLNIGSFISINNKNGNMDYNHYLNGFPFLPDERNAAAIFSRLKFNTWLAYPYFEGEYKIRHITQIWVDAVKYFLSDDGTKNMENFEWKTIVYDKET